MKSLTVETHNKNYNIYFTNSFNPLGEILALGKYSKIAIISDSNVFPIYGDALISVCKEHYENISSYTFKAGELSKNINTMTDFYQFCVESKLDRHSIILALGGGVTGDMAGFLSATFMRGIAYGQIPTSLLAQVDSSVGGKTGIDFMGYKNIVGAFYQPDFVFMNTSTLKTLPEREFASGMGEVIKHGCILDQKYLQTLISEKTAIQNLKHDALTEMIMKSCTIKASVVKEDEKEHGVRALLNFGHTFGHAIEKLCDFSLSHGACVAIGSIAAAYISKKKNYISDSDFNLIINTINSYGLPTSVSGMTSQAVYNDMFLDKKTSYNQLKLILLQDIGKAFITSEIEKELIIEAIDYVLQ